jgi:4-phytase/acid phosphatase
MDLVWRVELTASQKREGRLPLQRLLGTSHYRSPRTIQPTLSTVIAVALLFASAGAESQSPANKEEPESHLRFTLILSRHGIRPPLVAASNLNLRASDPWPEWEVPLGYLTPHGALAIKKMGTYMRLDFARRGLLSRSGCPDSGEIYLYADTDERNVESTRATLAGLEPGCDSVPINTIDPALGVKDPLFSAVPSTFAPPPKDAADADFHAAVGNDPVAFFSSAANPGLDQLARILAPDHAHPAAKPILDDARPLTAASTLIEDLLLEYLDDKPMSEVGWGRIDEPALRRLLPLHTKQFSLGTRTPLNARTEGSNLMAHILWTLEQAAQSREHKPVPGALGPVSTRLVYVSGHDSNLCNIGGLLDVRWDADGRTDDTPPDSQIVFELWQSARTKEYTVRLRFRAQTIGQLRFSEDLTLSSPPVEVNLTPPGCHSSQPCSFSNFDHAVHSLLDPAYIKADLLPTRVAAAQP